MQTASLHLVPFQEMRERPHKKMAACSLLHMDRCWRWSTGKEACSSQDMASGVFYSEPTCTACLLDHEARKNLAREEVKYCLLCQCDPSLYASGEAFMHRRGPQDQLIFVEEEDHRILIACSKTAAKTRPLAGACIVDGACGLRVPFVLHCQGLTVQLSRMDMPCCRAIPVLSFELPGPGEVCSTGCQLGSGPTIMLPLTDGSWIVAFRDAHAAQPEQGSMGAASWRVHHLHLARQAGICRALLVSSNKEHSSAACRMLAVSILLSVDQSPGLEADAQQQQHQQRLLQLTCMREPSGRFVWSGDELSLPRECPRLAAACWVPPTSPATSSALAAGTVLPAQGLALATEQGEVSSFACPPSHSPSSALQQCLEQMCLGHGGAKEATLEASHVYTPAGRAQWVRRVLRQSRSEGPGQSGAAISPDTPACSSERCQLVAQTKLEQPVQQLGFTAEAGAGLLLARGGDRGSTLSCLAWPHLQRREVISAVEAVVLDPSGLQVFRQGAHDSPMTDCIHACLL
jgi:hypothetical protein